MYMFKIMNACNMISLDGNACSDYLLQMQLWYLVNIKLLHTATSDVSFYCSVLVCGYPCDQVACILSC